MASVQFHIKGMSCAGCAQSIQRRLQLTPGVEISSVDLASASAAIEFDDRITDSDSLEKIIESLGFNIVDSRTGCG